MALGEVVSRFVAGDAEGHDERQIVEDLQRCSGARWNSCGSRPIIGDPRWATDVDIVESCQLARRCPPRSGRRGLADSVGLDGRGAGESEHAAGRGIGRRVAPDGFACAQRPSQHPTRAPACESNRGGQLPPQQPRQDGRWQPARPIGSACSSTTRWSTARTARSAGSSRRPGLPDTRSPRSRSAVMAGLIPLSPSSA